MGNFKVTIGVSNPDRSRFEKVEALVDTGATYTQLPGPLLRDLGITPIEKRTFIITGGHRITGKVGEAPLQIDDMVRTSPVIFGDDESDILLGAVTLEVFGLGVDPVNQKLIPVEGLLVGILEVGDEPLTLSQAGRRRR